jgi:quercetin dioxygenase-like cupin family protein
LIPPQLLADGYLARAVHGKQLTLALVEVEAGAVLPEHQHPNEQFGMVIEGSVVFRVGEETRTVEPAGGREDELTRPPGCDSLSN